MKNIDYYLTKSSVLFTGVFVLGMTLSWSFPPHAISWWPILAVAIFLLGLEKQSSAKQSFCYGYIFYLGAGIAFIGQWFSYYFRLQLGCGYFVSYCLTMILCFYSALYLGIISWLYHKLKTSVPAINLLLLFPALWTTTELLRDLFFPRSWYALGYTQVNNLLARGYYPLLGVYFVTFIVVFAAGLVALPFMQRNVRQLRLSLVALFGLGVISYSLAQINYTQPYGKSLRVALLQPSIFSTKNYTMDTLLSIEKISQQLIEQVEAQLIVLPETVFGTGLNYLSPGYLEHLNQIVTAKNASLIFGTPIHELAGEEQTGSVISTNPEHPIYRKHHLVPFGEYNPLKDTFLAPLLGDAASMITEYTPGATRQIPTELYGQKFALDICYENAINDFVAQNAKDATIMLNQSDLSWYGKTNMKDAFFQFSQARALENQRYFLQDGNTGDTAIINRYGQVESKIEPYVAGAAIGMAQGYSGVTPFERFGNLPLWLLCGGIIILAALWRAKIRANSKRG
jgi:apolipoprotein N-acyltransferase